MIQYFFLTINQHQLGLSGRNHDDFITNVRATIPVMGMMSARPKNPFRWSSQQPTCSAACLHRPCHRSVRSPNDPPEALTDLKTNGTSTGGPRSTHGSAHQDCSAMPKPQKDGTCCAMQHAKPCASRMTPGPLHGRNRTDEPQADSTTLINRQSKC